MAVMPRMEHQDANREPRCPQGTESDTEYGNSGYRLLCIGSKGMLSAYW